MLNTEVINYKIETIRDAAILTTDYVASDVMDDVEDFNEFNVYCYFTLGSLTSLDIKIESSVDYDSVTETGNWVQETNLTISGGTGTLNKGSYNTTEDGNFKISIPLSARYVRVSAKGNGTVTSSSLQLDGFLHTV